MTKQVDITAPPRFFYSPSEYGIVRTYQAIEDIYNERISATCIKTVKHTETGQTLIQKQVQKSKLFGQNQLPQARIEC